MTKQERIFDALGGVDEMLLARSEQTVQYHRPRWVAWGTAMAACLALTLLVWGVHPKSPAAETDTPVTDAETGIPIISAEPDTAMIGEESWNEGPRIHLLSFKVPMEEQSGPQFYLHIDEEGYYTCWKDGVYVVQPRKSLENLPSCVMEISHIDTAPEQAAQTVRTDLESRYASVTEVAQVTDEIAWKFPANTLNYFVASNGTDWADAQRETFLVNDGQGGVFVVSYGYYMEAAEGHGTRFAGMAATFQAISTDDVPARIVQLDDTVEKLMRGVFYGEMEEAADLLLHAAEIDIIADMADDVVIRRIDKVLNHETAPTAAIVTIPYTLSPEEPGGTLVMKLSYEESTDSWLAWRIELEQ